MQKRLFGSQGRMEKCTLLDQTAVQREFREPSGFCQRSEEHGVQKLTTTHDTEYCSRRLKPHPNVVVFLGACTDPEHPICIVTELVEGGR